MTPTDDVALPELPAPGNIDYACEWGEVPEHDAATIESYTADQMHVYATTAVLADRARAPQPVALPDRAEFATLIRHYANDLLWKRGAGDSHAALMAAYDAARASVSEDAARLAVIDAAVKWWEGSRPMAWDEAEHLRHPEVNQPSASEKNLASAVAAARKP